MSSRTDVANMSLRHLKIGTVLSDVDTDTSHEARVCRDFLNIVRDDMLRLAWWPFATKFAALTEVEDPPDEIDQEWTHSYRYPTDCLMVRRIVAGGRDGTDQEAHRIGHDATGRLIYCDVESVELEYTKQETDFTTYPADYVLAMTYRLASLIAPALAEENGIELVEPMMRLYRMHLGMALANHFNEERPDEYPDASWIRGR